MSGVPIPLSSWLASPDGGKFAGMRTIVDSMPCCSRSAQNGVPCRSNWTLADDSGNCHFPTLIDHEAGSVFVVERYGTIVFGSLWMKSKMPCPPGSRPVMKLDHATGLWGGIDVPRGEKVPLAASRAKFGMRPLAMRSRVNE